MRQLSQDDYVANTALIHKVARGCFARCQAIGVAMDYDDVFQELSLTFVKAWERFDESKGFQFSTYYVMAARNEFNRFVAKLVAERVEHGVRSIEEINERCGEDDSLSIEETLSSGDLSPEARAIVAQRLERLERRLRPLTRVVIEWLVSPPEEFSAELAALTAHAGVAREQGVTMRPRLEASIGAILGFLQMLDPEHVTRLDMQETRQEIDFLLRELEMV